MKYSNYIGTLSALTLIISCFLPWAYIPSIDSTLTGFDTSKTNFGKPGYLNVVFSALAIIFFLTPRLWAKRVNLFLAAFNLAWTIRNFVLFGLCELGECPDKMYGIYLSLVSSVALILMALFPTGSVKTNKD